MAIGKEQDNDERSARLRSTAVDYSQNSDGALPRLLDERLGVDRPRYQKTRKEGLAYMDICDPSAEQGDLGRMIRHIAQFPELHNRLLSE